MTRPGPSVTSNADVQPGSDSLFPTGFSGGGALVRQGSVGTGEIADGSVASADLNLSSVASALVTRSEFTITYARVSTPSLMSSNALTKPFNGMSSIYNLKASNTRRMRRARARALAGTGYLRVYCGPGDSTTEGVGGSGNVSVTSYPMYLRSLLAAQGLTLGGTGWVNARNNNTPDSRWTYTGWTTFGPITQFIWSTASGRTATFTSDVAGTIFEFATLRTSGAMTLTIDGATPANGSVTTSSGMTYNAGTITTDGASLVGSLSVSGLANTTHTAVLTTTSASNTYIIAAQVRGSSGVLVTNAGIGTAKTSDWLPTNAFYTPGPTGLALQTPDVSLISLFINDSLLAPGQLATSQANLNAIVSAHQAVGDVILWVPPTPQPSVVYGGGTTPDAATWLTYRQAMYTAAETYDVPLVDLGDRWGDYAAANTATYMNDSLHPSTAGYADLAQALASALAA